jgi:hypothetical protein
MGIMLIHISLKELPGTRHFWEHRSFGSTFLILLLVPYALTLLLTRFSVTRAFFLGSEKDLAATLGRIPFFSKHLGKRRLSTV